MDQARGDDANDGLTWGTAKRTANAALDVALATPEADVLRVAEGVYREMLYWFPTDISMVGGHASGGAERDPRLHPTVFEGGTMEMATITGGTLSDVPLVFDGITVRDAPWVGLALAAKNLEVRDCVFERIGWTPAEVNNAHAVYLSADTGAGTEIGNVLVENCIFRDNRSFTVRGTPHPNWPRCNALLIQGDRGIIRLRDTVFERNNTPVDGLGDFWIVNWTGIDVEIENVRANAAVVTGANVNITNSTLMRYLEMPCYHYDGRQVLMSNVTMGQLRFWPTSVPAPPPIVIRDSIIVGRSDGAAVTPIAAALPACPPATVTVEDSIVPGGWGYGARILDTDPNLVTGPLGDAYLAHAAAGDPATSPAVDAGSRTAIDATLDLATTRVDGGADSGVVDMGYHYPPVTSLAIRRATDPRALADHATVVRLPWSDDAGTASDPALRVLYYDIPGAENELDVTLDRTADAPRLCWR